MNIQIYTDGACSKNPGPGGYAFVIIIPNEEPLKFAGYKEQSTNNEMELYSIAKVLSYLKRYIHYDKCSDSVEIYSDSAYCINPINQGWLYSWCRNGWISKQGEEIKNKELWKYIYKALCEIEVKISFVKVKGHSGDKYNEMVDKAAKNAIKRNLNT